MFADPLNRLEALAGVKDAGHVGAETRRHLSSPSGLGLAAQLTRHLSAYNATDDVVPFFGDHRLAYTEAMFQLQNSVCLAYHGFYSQALSTLRSVCELSLLQASLPEGESVSERKLGLVRAMFPPDVHLPGADEANWVVPLGFGARQSPRQDATSLEEWAVDGCRTPRWQVMRDRLLDSSSSSRFDSEARLSARLEEALGDLDPYVHARGYLRSATGLSNGNMLRFSRDSLRVFCDRMMCATQVSIEVLLVAYLPTATSHPNAATGFIDDEDLETALGVLLPKNAALLKAMYEGRPR